MVKAVLNTENYITKISKDSHSIIADEPIDLGGQDKGMTPMDLLSSALASCTAITLKMYASRKEWEIKEIDVQVSSSKNENQTNFNREIRVIGSIDATQKKRLLAIANACPIHKILKGEIDISTEIKN